VANDPLLPPDAHGGTVAPNLEPLAMQMSWSGLEEIWSPYLWQGQGSKSMWCHTLKKISYIWNLKLKLMF